MNLELKRFIDRYIKEDTNTKMVTVFPLACGTGKSEYIRYAIADALENNHGLIVVTDLIDRLNSYTLSQDERLAEYIKRNIDRISILNSTTISVEVKVLHKKPIVLMSTQRYFDLTKDEIRHYTATREKIIFDEKPFILVSHKITIDSLNQVDSALNEALDDTVNQEEKRDLIDFWNIIESELKGELKRNEALNIGYKREIYFDGANLSEIDAVKTFYSLIKKYEKQLKKYNPKVIKTIEAVKQLMKEGIVTSQKMKFKSSGNDYDNYFTVIINNIEKLTNIDAKVYVLDGTADISPEYQLNCVNMPDCSCFNRDLSNLIINIVDVNTSKDKLTIKVEKTQNLIQTIINYIKAQPQNINTVFTYKAIANKFANDFDNVNWFGNIKGSNQYREINNICQVGLNRYSDLIYMLYANSINSYNDGNANFNKRIYDKETIDDIRCRLILADFEQNLFRCKIRNTDNSEICTYTLICNVSERNGIYENYQPLINMIKARYEMLGARVNIFDTPAQFKLLKAKERKTKKKTSIQKFEEWYKRQPKERMFKRADIILECGLTESQFKDLKKSGILTNLSTDKQGVYIVI